jgi:hypothetical protein
VPEVEPLCRLVPVLVLPDVGEVGVAEDEPVVAPGGVRVVRHLVAQHALQELSPVPASHKNFTHLENIFVVLCIEKQLMKSFEDDCSAILLF